MKILFYIDRYGFLMTQLIVNKRAETPYLVSGIMEYNTHIDSEPHLIFI